MLARSTNQILLILELGRSSDKIKIAQAREQVKAQMTKAHMPPPKLSTGSSHQTARGTKQTQKVSTENLTLRDDHTHKITSGVKNLRSTTL
jgi:hypothetical protein